MKETIMSNKKIFLFLLCSVQLYANKEPQEPAKKHAIFDLQVLIEPDRAKAVNLLGGYIKIGWQMGSDAPNLENIFIQTLNSLSDEQHPTIIWKGEQAPPSICQLVTSEKPHEKIHEDVLSKIDKTAPKYPDFMKRLADFAFLPEKNATVTKPVDDALTLAKELNNKGYTVHIFGNYGAEAFKKIQEKHPKVTKHITGQKIVSGEMKKPKNTESYKEFCVKAGINIEQDTCLFIEAEQEYQKMAASILPQSNHHKAVWCEKRDFKKLRSQIQPFLESPRTLPHLQRSNSVAKITQLANAAPSQVSVAAP